jgi:hypothetical protein
VVKTAGRETEGKVPPMARIRKPEPKRKASPEATDIEPARAARESEPGVLSAGEGVGGEWKEWMEAKASSLLKKVNALSIELADASWNLGDAFLDAARVLEGVRICMGDRTRFAKLARAATDLAGSASKLPRNHSEIKHAVDALVGAVQVAQDRPPVSPESIATLLAVVWRKTQHLGTLTLIGAEDEAEVQKGCARAIEQLQRHCIGELFEKLRFEILMNRPRRVQHSETEELEEKLRREFTSGTRRLDPEAVVTACARMSGETRELFGSHRKAAKRDAHKHK